jgi:hypothetical protein
MKPLRDGFDGVFYEGRQPISVMGTRKFLRIEISGESTSDLEIALEQIVKKVSEGYLSGFVYNDTSDYEFNLTEEIA